MKTSRVRLGRLTIIAASIQLIFSDPALANPTGPQVVNGAATIQRPDARTLSVTNTPGTIINWQGFSIGAGEATRFIQHSPSSAVLNRVVGADISQIHGQLLSNGRVFLINPSGIVIGPGASIDTAGFVASTLNMLDGDFLAGKLKFEGDANSGSIINQGWIRTGYGGQVILVAPHIENSGLIHTPGGEILLAAGKKLTITSLDLEGVQFEVQAPTDSVLNVGKLLADGGAVGVFAGSLTHSGEIRANALVYDEAGRIVLKAQNEIQIAGGSSTSADGKNGGDITIQSTGGSTRVAGNVSAQGSAGEGGDIQILGERVAVVEDAAVNASGSAGGGQIRVGGDFQGNNPDVPNSTNTFVGADASLRADATESGDGGRVIVWSDDKAQYYGSLSAQGGPQGGDGGFAEVSGKQNLIFAGSADLGAPKGALGNLLLDPLDLYVFSGGGLDPTIIDETTDFPANAATVSPATLAAISGNVSLFASRYMRISDPIDFSATTGKGLTAQVGVYTAPALPDPLALSTSVLNLLEIGADITTAGGVVSLSAPRIQSFNSPVISTGGGAINLNGTTSIDAFSLTLNAGSGAVAATAGAVGIDLGDIAGGSVTATTSSSIDVGDVSAGGGTVSLAGNNGVFTDTIDTSGSVILNASTGSIFSKVNNASALTASAGFGVFINSDTHINVDTVTAGSFSTASLSSFGGAIRANSASSQVSGFDVTLSSTDTGSGGGIGLATPLNVNVQRQLSFTTNAGFNVFLNGTGPNRLFATLNPAHAMAGSYMGTISKQGGGFSLNASADTTTVTLSDLTITSGFDQFSSNISLSTSGNLIASSIAVAAGNNVSAFQLPVSLSASGNLTLNAYTRAAGGLLNQTSIFSGGIADLGLVNAGNDNVTVSGTSGITVSSLIANGNTVTLTSGLGAVNAAADNVGVEIAAAGATLNITGRGIGTAAFGNPLDLAAATINLTANGGVAIGGANPVVASTQDLRIGAGSGSTFNVSTGALDIKTLTVTANPTAVAGGLAQITSNGALYNFNNDADNTRFTFDLNGGLIPAPQFDAGTLSFTSTTGDISLNSVAANLGTGNLNLSANGGGIINGASIAANNVTLNAATDISTSSITAGGSIELHGRSTVVTGELTAAGQVLIDGCFSFCGSPTVTSGAVTAGGNVTLEAGGLLTVGGAVTGANGGTIALRSGGGTPFTFSEINAGDTGTVRITSSSGIRQQFMSAGITAQNIELYASGGDIAQNDSSMVGALGLDLLNGTNNLKLTAEAGNDLLLDANGRPFDSINISTNGTPDTGTISVSGLHASQSLSVSDMGNGDFNLALSSTGALDFSFTANNTGIRTTGGGIVTSGGDVTLNVGGGTSGINAATGGITTGGGAVVLEANGSGGITTGTIVTSGGLVEISAFGGSVTGGTITTGGGALTIRTDSAAGDIDVAGNLNAGAGRVELIADNAGDISGGGSITSTSSAEVRTSGGDIGTIGTPLQITSPEVTLNAEGLVTATLTDTSSLSLSGAQGFAVTSTNTAFANLFVGTRGTGTGAVTLSAPGQTFSFSRVVSDLFGPVTDTFQVFSVGGTPVTNATFSVSDGTLLVAGPGTINATNLMLSSTNGADISLQGTAASPLNLSSTSQTFSASGATTADLLIRGKVTLDATASQLFEADGNVTIDANAGPGGGGAVSLTAPNQTFRTTGGSSKIELLGGAAAGEKVTVTSTNAQTVNTASSSVDSFKLKGGSGTDASVTFSHSGVGFQDFEISNGTITVEGGSGLNAFAKIEETGTNQQEICRVTPFFGCVPVGSLRIIGGTGTGAYAELTADGPQRVLFSNSLTVQGGSGSGAYALLQAGTTQQIFGGSSLTVTAGGAGQTSEPFIAVPGANAIIEGHNQFISISGAVSLNGGAGVAGNTSDALIRNLSGSQFVGGNSISLNGGHTESTTGILNLGAGSQTISGNGGVLLRSDPNLPPAHADAFVLIQNMGTGVQSITGGLTLVNSGQGTVAVTTADDQTITANSGGVSLNVSDSGSTSVTAGGDQAVRARFVEVMTAIGSTGDAVLTAAGNQYIRTTNENANGESLVVAALGSGTAKIESGASQLLEIGYPSMMQQIAGSGLLALGQANGVAATGNSLVQAVDQNVFAGSILVQGPSGAGAISKLSATNTQTISTLLGGIHVVGGAGDNSLATIDPLTQTILVNGSVDVAGGAGANADSSIVSGGSQTLANTNGNISLTGGTGDGSDAIISSLGAQAIASTGNVALTGGTGSNADALIDTSSLQSVIAAGDITLIGGPIAGSDAIISNIGAQQGCSLLSFLCGAQQTLVAGGSIVLSPGVGNAVITGGQSSNSTGAAAFLSADATQQTLSNTEELFYVFDALAPGTEDPDFRRQVPICR